MTASFPNEPTSVPTRFPFENHAAQTVASTSPACELRLSLHSAPHHTTMVKHRIPHIRQMYNWDCGLACVLMVLRGFGFHACDYALLRQLCPTTSIWTVDLAHLLRRFGLEVSITTITVGINPAFARETFYQDTLEEDALRIQRLFIDASRAGVCIQQRSLSSDDLQALVLCGRYILVVLLDKRRLSPWLAAADMCLPALCGLDMGYMGHYVVVSGFDPQRQDFFIQDPAAGTPNLRVPASQLDEARKSFGTDEDLLLIGVPPAVQQQLASCSAECFAAQDVACCASMCGCCSK